MDQPHIKKSFQINTPPHQKKKKKQYFLWQQPETWLKVLGRIWNAFSTILIPIYDKKQEDLNI